MLLHRVPPRRSHLLAALATIGLLVAACSSNPDDSADAGNVAGTTTTLIPQTTVDLATTTTIAELPTRDGAVTMSFRAGPFAISPGQNNISYQRNIPQPDVNGWIVGFRPNLEYDDGTIPAVDVVHLHHGVWLKLNAGDATSPLPQRFFAAGEEKTNLVLPAPYGYRYETADRWMLNYMLHNLTPDRTEVWVTYEIDIIPDDAPQAAGMLAARPVWMDVQNGQGYPVFDVLRGDGDGVTYTLSLIHI